MNKKLVLFSLLILAVGTLYGPCELTRYILAYREHAVIPTILDTTTKLELAGMWTLWATAITFMGFALKWRQRTHRNE